jgi:hypothetical protein
MKEFAIIAVGGIMVIVTVVGTSGLQGSLEKA